MFNLFKSKPSVNPPNRLRETFFGDYSMESLCAEVEGPGTGHQAHFVSAKNALMAGDQQTAIAQLKMVTEMPELESRLYLAAWFQLGKLGVEPDPEIAQKVLGVVLEVWMDKGLDVLAAYEDGTARYVNFSDAIIIWDAPGTDAQIEQELRHLLKVGQAVASRIGPWEGKGKRPEPPAYGLVRLNMLTPSGVHFGQGEYADLSGDPMGGALLNAGAALMQRLTEKHFATK